VNESIDGVFSSAVLLNAFRIVFLYNGSEVGEPHDISALPANGCALVGTLTVGDLDNTASWSLGGTVTSCGGHDR
jgi:hypothetical protein